MAPFKLWHSIVAIIFLSNPSRCFDFPQSTPVTVKRVSPGEIRIVSRDEEFAVQRIRPIETPVLVRGRIGETTGCRDVVGVAVDAQNASVGLASLRHCVREDRYHGLISVGERQFELSSSDNSGHVLRTISNGRTKREVDDNVSATVLESEDWLGYFIGKLWDFKQEREEDDTDATKNKRGEIVCNGNYCEYFKVL